MLSGSFFPEMKWDHVMIHFTYCIAWKFGKSFMICQTKTILISTYNNNLLADLLIRQTFFRQRLKQSKFAKLYPCQTFPLYRYHVWT